MTLSTLIVLDRAPQLRQHLGNALHGGLTPEHLVELIIHATWYGGAPAGMKALATGKEVFAARGSAFTPPRVHDANEDPQRLSARGNALRQRYMGPQPSARSAPPTETEREEAQRSALDDLSVLRADPGLRRQLPPCGASGPSPTRSP